MYNARILLNKSRGSVGSIATGYWLDDRGVGVRVAIGSQMVISPYRSYRLSGPPNLISNGYKGLFASGVKLPGREADHSSPTNTEINKLWVSTSILPYVFIS
jgi:hypothetical protein